MSTPHTKNRFMKLCEITQAHPHKGSKIHRRGLAKKKGGIGRHVTKVVKRKVSPNLQDKRIWVPEFGHYVRLWFPRWIGNHAPGHARLRRRRPRAGRNELRLGN